MNETTAFLQLLALLLTDPRIGVLFALLILASVIDYRTYRIPNWLTLSGVVYGLMINTAFPLSSHAGFVWAFGGMLLGLLMLLPLYALKAMGAGDVKLMAMVGAFLGITDTFYAVVFTFIVGGVAALGFAVIHKAMGRMLSNIRHLTQAMLLSAVGGIKPSVQIEAGKSVGRLPYGVSISVATIGYVVAKQFGYA